MVAVLVTARGHTRVDGRVGGAVSGGLWLGRASRDRPLTTAALDDHPANKGKERSLVASTPSSSTQLPATALLSGTRYRAWYAHTALTVAAALSSSSSGVYASPSTRTCGQEHAGNDKHQTFQQQQARAMRECHHRKLLASVQAVHGSSAWSRPWGGSVPKRLGAPASAASIKH